MKKFKTLATMTAIATTMIFASATQAGPTQPTPGPLPGPVYTIQECNSLSQRIDTSYSYGQSLTDMWDIILWELNHGELVIEYDLNCINVPHTY